MQREYLADRWGTRPPPPPPPGGPPPGATPTPDCEAQLQGSTQLRWKPSEALAAPAIREGVEEACGPTVPAMRAAGPPDDSNLPSIEGDEGSSQRQRTMADRLWALSSTRLRDIIDPACPVNSPDYLMYFDTPQKKTVTRFVCKSKVRQEKQMAQEAEILNTESTVRCADLRKVDLDAPTVWQQLGIEAHTPEVEKRRLWQEYFNQASIREKSERGAEVFVNARMWLMTYKNQFGYAELEVEQTATGSMEIEVPSQPLAATQVQDEWEPLTADKNEHLGLFSEKLEAREPTRPFNWKEGYPRRIERQGKGSKWFIPWADDTAKIGAANVEFTPYIETTQHVAKGREKPSKQQRSVDVQKGLILCDTSVGHGKATTAATWCLQETVDEGTWVPKGCRGTIAYVGVGGLTLETAIYYLRKLRTSNAVTYSGS